MDEYTWKEGAGQRQHNASSPQTNGMDKNQQNSHRISKSEIMRAGWHLQESLPSYQEEKDQDGGCEMLDEFMAVSVREVEIVDDDG
jgi:hypothetical protein